MRTIDVFLQGDGVTDIVVLAAAPQDTIAYVLSKLEHAAAAHRNLLVFLEDVAAPLDEDAVVEELLPLATEEDGVVGPLRLHLSRCHKVEVTVRFNGENEKRRFPPSATVERVRRWAVRRAFDLSPIDAAEHVLQLQNSTMRPDRDVHIGTLTGSDTCMVAFDLVPSKRVEG
jgi:hypothetical protein